MPQYINKLIRQLRHRAKLHPAALLLIGLLAGILSCKSALGIYLLPVLPVCGNFLFGGRKTGYLVLFIIIGIMAVKRVDNQAVKTEIAGLCGPAAGARARIEVVEAACCGPGIKWLPNPGLIRARLMSYTLNDGIRRIPEYTTCVALRLPSDSAAVKYGDILEISGRFELPQAMTHITSHVLSGESEPTVKALPGFNLRNYMRIRGQAALLRADSVVVSGYNSGWFSQLLLVRSSLLSIAAAPLKNDADRAMLAALCFGCRQGLDQQTRQAFIRSGTVHLFTVSGMHVGILALLLWFILRPLPFRARYLIAPAILLVYVLMTGAQPPAIRALLMIAIWSIFRAFSLRTPILNVVFLAAILLLIYNPLYLESMGFQFSFVVTGFLLAAGRRISRGAGHIGEQQRWIPPEKRKFIFSLDYRGKRALVKAGSGCFAAWLAGCAICLYSQGLFVPAAVGANLLITPLVCVLYLLIFPMTLLSGTIFGNLFGWLISSMFSMMTGVGEFFQAAAGLFSCPRPPGWSLFFFYAGLLMLAGARSKRWFCGGLGLTAAVILFWHIRIFTLPDTVTVFYGGSASTPALLICSPAIDRAVLLDVPSYDTANAVSSILREKGISKLDTVAFSASNSETARGFEPMISMIKVMSVLPPDKVFPHSTLSRSLDKFRQFGGIVLESREENLCNGVKIVAKKNCKSVEYQVLYNKVKASLSAIQDSGCWGFDISDGALKRHCELCRGTPMLIDEYEIR